MALAGAELRQGGLGGWDSRCGFDGGTLSEPVALPIT